MPAFSVIPYQPRWPQQFAELAQVLRAAVPVHPAVVEHIGSTAVPGLCAKPVIDIALGVETLSVVPAHVAALAAQGFDYRPAYEVQIPQRRYFVRSEGAHLRVHLHVLVMGGDLWRQHLRFRDALRADPALRDAYAQRKLQLARQYADDKAAYTEAKAPFIRQVLAAPAH